MVEDVARDIFGIELSSDGKASSVSPIQEDNATSEVARDSFNDQNTDSLSAEVEVEVEEGWVEVEDPNGQRYRKHHRS